ncbi:MAG: hypothetical protein WCO45_07855 [Pseudanabaena sp. ELA607]|jgi:hypothetical protein
MNNSQYKSSDGNTEDETISQQYNVIPKTGEVAGSKTWSDTIVTGSGGGGYVGKYGGYVAAPKISSTVKIRTVFYMILDNGQEVQIDSSGWDFSPRDGQRVTAIFYEDLKEKDLVEGDHGDFVTFLRNTTSFLNTMSGQSVSREYVKLYYLYNHNSSEARISNEVANLNKASLPPTLIAAILTALIIFIPFSLSISFKSIFGFLFTAWLGYNSFKAILPHFVKWQQESKQKYQYLVDSADAILENTN